MLWLTCQAISSAVAGLSARGCCGGRCSVQFSVQRTWHRLSSCLRGTLSGAGEAPMGFWFWSSWFGSCGQLSIQGPNCSSCLSRQTKQGVPGTIEASLFRERVGSFARPLSLLGRAAFISAMPAWSEVMACCHSSAGEVTNTAGTIRDPGEGPSASRRRAHEATWNLAAHMPEKRQWLTWQIGGLSMRHWPPPSLSQPAADTPAS